MGKLWEMAWADGGRRPAGQADGYLRAPAGRNALSHYFPVIFLSLHTYINK